MRSAFEINSWTSARALRPAIVRDGEGATKFVQIDIEGAPSEEAAHTIGRTIARSPLVKTAIYGADPNWGRIVGAIGNSGVALKTDRVDIYIDGVLIFRRYAGADATETSRKRNSNSRRARLRFRLSSSLDLRFDRRLHSHQCGLHDVNLECVFISG
jgi:glutamate N-acetyltransferase/amino-acid N-acetyltransferase